MTENIHVILLSVDSRVLRSGVLAPECHVEVLAVRIEGIPEIQD